jgi:hypothetical protein
LVTKSHAKVSHRQTGEYREVGYNGDGSGLRARLEENIMSSSGRAVNSFKMLGYYLFVDLPIYLLALARCVASGHV